jgi:Serine/threonine protein phosphatase
MMSVHLISLQGRRPENEDKHTAITNINNKIKDLAPVNLFGVYDGHGGKFVSEYLSKNLPQLFMNKQVKYPLERQYILDVYDSLQNILKTKYRSKALKSGSTCLVLIHSKNKEERSETINLINVGDSRCVLCRENFAIPLTKDHKPNGPEERGRILNLGGNIEFDGDDYRIKKLSVSRAFGDISAEPYVTHVPDTFKFKLEKNDKFVVLGCDGLWDKLTSEEVVNFVLLECYDRTTNVRINKQVNAALKLAEYAIQKGSTDNVTAIIVFFDNIITNDKNKNKIEMNSNKPINNNIKINTNK